MSGQALCSWMPKMVDEGVRFVFAFCRCYLDSNLIVLRRFMWSADRRRAAPSSFYCSTNSDLFWSAANPGWHKDNFEISLQSEKFVGRRQLSSEMFSLFCAFLIILMIKIKKVEVLPSFIRMNKFDVVL